MVPLEIPLKGKEGSHVRDTAAGGSHGLQGGSIQLSRLLQTQLFLHLEQCLAQGHLLATNLSLCLRGVAEPLQVALWRKGSQRGE